MSGRPFAARLVVWMTVGAAASTVLTYALLHGAESALRALVAFDVWLFGLVGVTM